MFRLVGVCLLAGLFTMLGCDRKPADPTPGKVTAEDVRHDAGQAVNTAAEYSQQSREEFQKDLGTRLDEMDANIVKLRDKGRDLKDQAKANWDQKMAELETKREAARQKLVEVGHANAEAWKDVKKGAQSAWDDLDKAFHDAAHEF